MNRGKHIVLVYDGDCPACSGYAKAMRIQSTVGDLQMVNARDDPQTVEEISALGIDIDHGMVVKVDDQFYSGADAIHAFALLGSRSGLINRLNYWLFKSRTRAKLLFPILRFLRNMLLLLLRRRNLGGDSLGVHDAGEQAVGDSSLLERHK